MFTKTETETDLIIIYYHEFDETTGRYLCSTPVSLCCEAALLQALNDAHAGMRAQVGQQRRSYLLESVWYVELSNTDRKVLAQWLLKSDMLFHQLAWGDAYGCEDTVFIAA